LIYKAFHQHPTRALAPQRKRLIHKGLSVFLICRKLTHNTKSGESAFQSAFSPFSFTLQPLLPQHFAAFHTVQCEMHFLTEMLSTSPQPAAVSYSFVPRAGVGGFYHSTVVFHRQAPILSCRFLFLFSLQNNLLEKNFTKSTKTYLHIYQNSL